MSQNTQNPGSSSGSSQTGSSQTSSPPPTSRDSFVSMCCPSCGGDIENSPITNGKTTCSHCSNLVKA